jgi:putative heme transporter
LKALGSLVVFLSFTVLSLFFMLKDGPVIRAWLERHLGVPRPVARTISGRTIGSMQGYFAGVTAIAAFNGIIIGLGAVVLGVPLAGSIAVVNFIAAYIPYLGAWTAGAFTVLVALGAEGPTTALIMAVVVLLANGALQQLIQPIAFGAALGIHPLAVLIVTIAGGALFGTIGLIVAAPLTSAVTKIARDLAVARSEEEDEVATGPPSSPAAPAPT